MKLSLYTLFIVCCLSLLLWAKPVVTDARVTSAKVGGTASMPQQCRPGKNSSQERGWRWAPRSVVHVYYQKNGFSKEQRDSLTQGVNSWNDAMRETQTQISFVIGDETDSLVEKNASITVLRGIPKGEDRVGQILLYSLSNGSIYASVTIGPATTNPDALRSLMVHEIGHSLGLADCYKCKRGTTAMAAFKSDNKGNDVYAPSECDKFVVAAGYKAGGDSRARKQ